MYYRDLESSIFKGAFNKAVHDSNMKKAAAERLAKIAKLKKSKKNKEIAND
jgi:hypothetical protein